MGHSLSHICVLVIYLMRAQRDLYLHKTFYICRVVALAELGQAAPDIASIFMRQRLSLAKVIRTRRILILWAAGNGAAASKEGKLTAMAWRAMGVVDCLISYLALPLISSNKLGQD